MKKSKLFTLILAIVAMMWTGNMQAQDGLVLGMTLMPTNHTGPVTGDGISGSVYYDAATKTLTLDNAQLESTEDCAFVNKVIDGDYHRCERKLQHHGKEYSLWSNQN